MRLQHLKQIANALTTDDPSRIAAKAVIIGEVERLHWRIGMATSPMRRKASIVSARSCVISRPSQAPESPLRRHANCDGLHALDGYLTGQSDWLVNYANAIVPDCELAPRSPKEQPISW